MDVYREKWTEMNLSIWEKFTICLGVKFTFFFASVNTRWIVEHITNKYYEYWKNIQYWCIACFFADFLQHRAQVAKNEESAWGCTVGMQLLERCNRRPSELLYHAKTSSRIKAPKYNSLCLVYIGSGPLTV